MSVAFTIIKMIISLGIMSVAYMIPSDIINVIININNPLASHVPQSGTDLLNFTLWCAKWIIVVFVISLLWKSTIESQQQTN